MCLGTCLGRKLRESAQNLRTTAIICAKTAIICDNPFFLNLGFHNKVFNDRMMCVAVLLPRPIANVDEAYDWKPCACKANDMCGVKANETNDKQSI